jgi:lipoprotein-anchoring transpeptidase ErfK/SrfK
MHVSRLLLPLFALFPSAVPLYAQPPVPEQAAPVLQPAPADVLAVQVRLDRLGFSTGEIDGRLGRNTNEALSAFQRAHDLAATGSLDPATEAALTSRAAEPVLVPYTITAEDVAGPFVPEIPTDLMAQASLPALGYRTVLEMIGERFHVSPRLLQRLNPAATFASPGEVISVPNVGEPAAVPAVSTASQDDSWDASHAVITVSRRAGVLTVRDASGALVFHAPVTVGSQYDPLPLGRWAVTSVTRNPLFNYNPDLFWDADPSHAKARLPAGPNNPVGLVWIALDKEHYGLHGTPEPGRIGHSESHGCVRLTNWDALRVASLATRGTSVLFTE